MIPLSLGRTLLLNASYEPLRVVHWQRAFGLVFQNKVEILEEYASVVRTVSRQFAVPAVIRLNRWIHLKRKPGRIRFSRANIYLRDDFTCQYCQHPFHETELTLDHVIPVVRGGKKSWENIVTACRKCNQSKGGRCPEKAGMRLLKVPRVPKWLPDRIGLEGVARPPKIWEPYLTRSG